MKNFIVLFLLNLYYSTIKFQRSAPNLELNQYVALLLQENKFAS